MADLRKYTAAWNYFVLDVKGKSLDLNGIKFEVNLMEQNNPNILQ